MAGVEVLGLHLLLNANRIQIRQHERHIKSRKTVSSSNPYGSLRGSTVSAKGTKSHLIIAIDYFVGTHHCKIFRLQ